MITLLWLYTEYTQIYIIMVAIFMKSQDWWWLISKLQLYCLHTEGTYVYVYIYMQMYSGQVELYVYFDCRPVVLRVLIWRIVQNGLRNLQEQGGNKFVGWQEMWLIRGNINSTKKSKWWKNFFNLEDKPSKIAMK